MFEYDRFDVFQRTIMLLGKENFEKLKNKKITIIGLGGVGSFCLEALARCGIENFVLIDKDIVSISNLNRQLIATIKTLGQSKVEVAYNRIMDINPNINAIKIPIQISQDNITSIPVDTDYIVDAIDDVKAKIAIINYAFKHNIKIISCMGTGNRLDPLKFRITDIYKTHNCPLAKKVRIELRKIGIKKLKVLFSEELPKVPDYKFQKDMQKKHLPASISFVPPVAGMILAKQVVCDLLDI
ncbi:ThiF family adenylyltransferase [Caldicellulosiruptoraceae bacterium PP1]